MLRYSLQVVLIRLHLVQQACCILCANILESSTSNAVKAAVTSAGATYAHKLRPVDVLEQILRDNRPGKLEQFFSLYGAPEASAMCFFLATAKDKNEVQDFASSACCT